MKEQLTICFVKNIKMEFRNHFKNGAKPKSHSSKGH
jgi:hypothetical protein